MTPPKPEPPREWPWIDAQDDPAVWTNSPVLNPANLIRERAERRARAERLQKAQRDAVLNMRDEDKDGSKKATD